MPKSKGLNLEGIKVARFNRGWTVKQVSEAAEISIPALHAIERGTRGASSIMAHRLAEVFGMQVDELAAFNKKLKKNGGDFE